MTASLTFATEIQRQYLHDFTLTAVESRENGGLRARFRGYDGEVVLLRISPRCRPMVGGGGIILPTIVHFATLYQITDGVPSGPPDTSLPPDLLRAHADHFGLINSGWILWLYPVTGDGVAFFGRGTFEGSFETPESENPPDAPAGLS